jgi:hypothetical protein
MKKLLTICVLAMLAGCAGEFDVFTNPDDPNTQFPGDGADGDDTDSPDGEGGAETEQLEPGFVIQREEVHLLPFHTRMQKLSRVTGLPVDDPLFDELNRSRYDLGDHNYGQGIGPDLSWTANKMSIWVRGLRPVCNSEAMASKYPFLPEHLNEMILDAYGREATEDDLADYDEILNDVELSDADRYEAVCLSVLTSTEFVAQ